MADSRAAALLKAPSEFSTDPLTIDSSFITLLDTVLQELQKKVKEFGWNKGF